MRPYSAVGCRAKAGVGILIKEQLNKTCDTDIMVKIAVEL